MSNDIFFTSDTHFGHENIIKYSQRPFADVGSMNEAMINNWNSVCSDKSIVYHLGDFLFGDEKDMDELYKRLKFQSLIVIRGNHEKPFIRWFFNRKPRNVILQPSSHHEIRIDDISITLNHYAMKVWNKSHFGAYHLYGHTHGTLPDDPNSRSFDVGVDCHNFTPISFQQMKDIMAKKTWKPTIK